MAFLLNQSLKMNLVRIDDYTYYNANIEEEVQYSLFLESIPEENGHICLLQNRHPEALLIPLYRQADYFLIFHEYPRLDKIPEYLKSLKKIPGILTAFIIDKPPAKKTAGIFEELEMHLMENNKY